MDRFANIKLPLSVLGRYAIDATSVQLSRYLIPKLGDAGSSVTVELVARDNYLKSENDFVKPSGDVQARRGQGLRELVQNMIETPTDRNEGLVSCDIADWGREKPRQFWDPGRKLLLTIRRYQHWRSRPGIIPVCFCKWITLRHRFWSVVTGADIPLNCNIGGGLLINHPNGIVIHPDAKIGVNCLIFQQVTIGMDRGGAPQIEGHVDIGAGAKILGAVKIGVHVKVGANAVVLKDVPDHGVAVGIPAQNIALL